MKLAIITFHRATNYGAVLQTYALNKTLLSLGMDAEVLNYRYNGVDNEYILFPKKASIKKYIKDIVYFPIRYKKNKKFDEFRNQYFKLSPTVYNSKNLESADQNYDIFLTGSDQVFNYKLTYSDYAYLLEFVNNSKKKNSYAASLGMDEIPTEKRQKYEKELKSFNRISVRETKAKEIIEELTGRKDIRVDIDPTFFISKDEWEEISIIPKEKDYVLLFVMQENDSILKQAEEYAQKRGLKLIYISNWYKRSIKANYKYNLSPEEWLGYFKNAECIFTNSFHGLAFSIILHKQFFLEYQKEPATANSRLENLITTLELQKRVIKNSIINEKDIINWNEVDKILNDKISNSLAYLRGLKEENE